MKALEYLLTRPLAVTPEALEAALGIVNRDPVVRPEAVQGKRGAAVDRAESGMTRRDGVCVIPVVGPIFRYADWFTDLCGGATVESIALDLQAAVDDPMCRAIVLNVDSPGGEAAGISELAEAVRAAGGRKPVVAYAGDMACSAAYWLAAAAGEVVCSETAMLGSIGVVMGYVRRDDRPGTKSYEFVSSQSPNKRPDLETEKGRAEVQRVVDDLADVFIGAVAAYRETTPEKVASDFGRGGVLVGRKAVEAGMADRVGSFESVIAELSDREGGPGRPGRSSAATAAQTQPKEVPVGILGFSFKPKADGSVAVEPLASDNAPAADAPAQPAAAAPAVRAELAAVRAELAKARAEKIDAQGEALYTKLFAANLVVPAEKGALVAAFTQASLDDLVNPLPGGKTRASLVEAVFANRTPHTLTKERMGDGPADPPSNLPPGYKALDHGNQGENKPPTQARLNELMGHLVAAGMTPPSAIKN